MSRATYRFREHTFVPDESPDAEPITYVMQCLACGRFGPRSEYTDDGTAWVVQHLKDNAGHLAYREHITRPYRFEAGAWQ
jgi:hypothetical protein